MKILLSDPHFQPFRDRKFESQKKNFFEIAIIMMEIFYHRVRSFIAFLVGKEVKILNREEKIFASIRRIVEQENIEVCISNGDFSESLYTEQGMRTCEDLEAANNLRRRFKQETGIKHFEENAGNHEFGYNLPLCTDPEAGVYIQGVQNFLKLTDREELYHSFMIDGYKVILIPYLFSEKKAVDFDISKEKDKFLSRFLNDMIEDIPVIIFIHDPDSLMDNKLLEVIRNNRKKIKFIFFGHYHSWVNLLGNRALICIYSVQWLFFLRWVLNLAFLILAKGDIEIVIKLGHHFRSRKEIPKIIKELNMILIPAPLGMLGIGGGFLTMEILDGSEIKIKKQ